MEPSLLRGGGGGDQGLFQYRSRIRFLIFALLFIHEIWRGCIYLRELKDVIFWSHIPNYLLKTRFI